jgi:hypothetical protein
VAALAGMFLGAAGGADVLPSSWRDAVRDHAHIEAVAGALAIRGEPRWKASL